MVSRLITFARLTARQTRLVSRHGVSDVRVTPLSVTVILVPRMIGTALRVTLRGEDGLILSEIGPRIRVRSGRKMVHLLDVSRWILLIHDTVVEGHSRCSVIVRYTLLVHPEDQLGVKIRDVPGAVTVQRWLMFVSATTLLVVALVEIAKVEAGGHVETAIGSAADLLIFLLIVTIHGADAAAAAASGPRRLRIDLLVVPISTRIRFRAACRSVTLGVQEVVLLEGHVGGHPHVCTCRTIDPRLPAILYHNVSLTRRESSQSIVIAFTVEFYNDRSIDVDANVARDD